MTNNLVEIKNLEVIYESKKNIFGEVQNLKPSNKQRARSEHNKKWNKGNPIR